MKKYAVFFYIFLFFPIYSTQAADIGKPLVISSLPATALLADHLAAGTGIETALIIPPSYAMAAQKNYFRKNKGFAKQAKTAAACITIASAWQNDTLYPFVRRHNIRIVAIDAAAPIDRSRTGVVLLSSQRDGKISPYIWRSPANLARMAEFICIDLQQLFPQYSPTLRKNLLILQRQIFRLRTRFEISFSDRELSAVAALTDAFDYLTSEFGIEVDRYFLKEEIDWTEKDCRDFARYLKENGVRVVLCGHSPREDIAEAIAAAGATPVVLQTLTIKKGIPPLEIFTRLYSTNLTAIIDAME